MRMKGTFDSQNEDRVGGADRDRTGDLLNAIQALSQLSYSPISPRISSAKAKTRMVAKMGLPNKERTGI